MVETALLIIIKLLLFGMVSVAIINVALVIALAVLLNKQQ